MLGLGCRIHGIQGLGFSVWGSVLGVEVQPTNAGRN